MLGLNLIHINQGSVSEVLGLHVEHYIELYLLNLDLKFMQHAPALIPGKTSEMSALLAILGESIGDIWFPLTIRQKCESRPHTVTPSWNLINVSPPSVLGENFAMIM